MFHNISLKRLSNRFSAWNANAPLQRIGRGLLLNFGVCKEIQKEYKTGLSALSAICIQLCVVLRLQVEKIFFVWIATLNFMTSIKFFLKLPLVIPLVVNHSDTAEILAVKHVEYVRYITFCRLI